MVEAVVDKLPLKLQWRAWSPPCGKSSAETGRVRVPGNELHLYRVPLFVPVEELSALTSILCPEELARTARFHFERHQRRYIVCRGTLRRILSSYLSTAPERIQFEYGPQGKPRLAAPYGSVIEFNLSHSNELALIAISSNSPVGVDVEYVRKLNDFDHMVARFFSSRESHLFAELTEAEKPLAFFHLWTRKEALLKTTGDGIGQYLNQVEVNFLDSEAAEILSLPAPFGNLEDWELQHLNVGDGYVGAVAVRCSNRNS